jgi:hypothetical protein
MRKPARQKRSEGGDRPPKPGGAAPTLAVRLPPDTDWALEAYAVKAGISRSEAARQLIERGLAKGRGGLRG